MSLQKRKRNRCFTFEILKIQKLPGSSNGGERGYFCFVYRAEKMREGEAWKSDFVSISFKVWLFLYDGELLMYPPKRN